MIIALQQKYLSWDVVSPVSYNAGEGLQCNLMLSNLSAEPDTFYVVGGLYNKATEELIPRTFFLLAGPLDGGYNSTTRIDTWTIEPADAKSWQCTLTFNKTNCLLNLFMYKRSDGMPNLEIDEQVGRLEAEIVGQELLSSWLPLALIGGLGILGVGAALALGARPR